MRSATGGRSTPGWCPGSSSIPGSTGGDRIVTFFNGNTVREVLVDLDDEARRLVWSIVGGPYAHHNGSAQVLAEGDGRTRFVWITDLLPNELAGRTSELMERGIRVLKETMEAGSAS